MEVKRFISAFILAATLLPPVMAVAAPRFSRDAPSPKRHSEIRREHRGNKKSYRHAPPRSLERRPVNHRIRPRKHKQPIPPRMHSRKEWRRPPPPRHVDRRWRRPPPPPPPPRHHHHYDHCNNCDNDDISTASLLALLLALVGN